MLCTSNKQSAPPTFLKAFFPQGRNTKELPSLQNSKHHTHNSEKNNTNYSLVYQTSALFVTEGSLSQVDRRTGSHALLTSTGLWLLLCFIPGWIQIHKKELHFHCRLAQTRDSTRTLQFYSSRVVTTHTWWGNSSFLAQQATLGSATQLLKTPDAEDCKLKQCS